MRTSSRHVLQFLPYMVPLPKDRVQHWSILPLVEGEVPPSPLVHAPRLISCALTPAGESSDHTLTSGPQPLTHMLAGGGADVHDWVLLAG
jgi:hypothetical protein